jgi:NAD-dependent SIR2 family protein deacetylase
MGNAALRAFIDRHPRLFVLTGAGCSTASGIPDYRDAAGEWKRAQPVQFRDFMGDMLTRRRYWARSLAGWEHFRRAVPNVAHHALAALERQGLVELLVTQNVDGLHQAAGSRQALDLHGRLDQVRCMACDARMPRVELQHQLRQRNPRWDCADTTVAPDGDAELANRDFSRFEVPDCRRCGGVLKPDVVFYGESVPAARVELAMQCLQNAKAVLVVGSSLMVYSGYRFVLAAARANQPIAAVNLGYTRADELLALKIDESCTTALADLTPLAHLAP